LSHWTPKSLFTNQLFFGTAKLLVEASFQQLRRWDKHLLLEGFIFYQHTSCKLYIYMITLDDSAQQIVTFLAAPILASATEAGIWLQLCTAVASE
jgi:hypothetical protein